MRTAVIWIARLEGVSLLLLYFVAMPLKYGAGLPEPVHYAGWAHGVLFMAFVAALAVGLLGLGWSLGMTALGFVASFLPFGTFVWERYLPEE